MKKIKMNLNFNKIMLFLLISILANVSVYANSQPRIIQTEGLAAIRYNTKFTYSVEKKDIQIPLLIDVDKMSKFSQVYADRDDGRWTVCRVPLKSELSLSSMVAAAKERTLTFKCQPIQFYK